MKALIYLICTLFILAMLVKCSKQDSIPQDVDQPVSVSVTIDSVGATSNEVRVR
jgi:hypothetical protein